MCCISTLMNHVYMTRRVISYISHDTYDVFASFEAAQHQFTT